MLEMELTSLSGVITAAVHAGGNTPNEGSGHDFVVLHAHFHRKQYTLLISAQITQQAGVEFHHLSLMLALSASEEATASDEKKGARLAERGDRRAGREPEQSVCLRSGVSVLGTYPDSGGPGRTTWQYVCVERVGQDSRDACDNHPISCWAVEVSSC